MIAVVSNVLLVKAMIRSKKNLYSENNEARRKAYADLRILIASSIFISIIFILYAFPRAIVTFVAILHPTHFTLTFYVLLNLIFRFIVMFNFFGLSVKNRKFREEIKSLIHC